VPWEITLVIAVPFILLLIWKVKSNFIQTTSNPYRKGNKLFSLAERSFLGVLDDAVGRDYRVFGKVRVADVINVRSVSDRSAWQRAFNKISAKHFDFIVCKRDDLSIIGAVELDDKSHQKSKRIVRDQFLEKICSDISLPLLKIKVQKSYYFNEIKQQVDEILKITPQVSTNKK
jgi:hypothetical protein